MHQHQLRLGKKRKRKKKRRENQKRLPRYAAVGNKVDKVSRYRYLAPGNPS